MSPRAHDEDAGPEATVVASVCQIASASGAPDHGPPEVGGGLRSAASRELRRR